MSSDAPTAPAVEVSPTNGACLCGKITYELIGNPIFSVLCHCDNCRKFSGAAFAWNHAFATPNVHITAGEDLLKTYEDTATLGGVPVHKKFCSNCGSSLIVFQPARPVITVVTSGTIVGDVSEKWKPMMEVFCKNRAKWLPDMGNKCFLESVPGK
ncbi:hypothetical protein BDW22DRAFT_1340609 [Trametopsis cervina]|nr:hypothetical protein BDW22DRAFT_1340609 [Trametopsis cervina]